jgi:tetratricopeptide (TPR) repeat protein
VLLSACASTPWQKPDSTAATDQSAADTAAPGSSGNAGPGGAGSGANSGAAGGKPSAAGAAGPAGPPSARATADFNRAVGFMRSGNATEAELEFKQMTLSYPRLSTPFVNLGILYRKAGRLDQSEEALKGAVERNGTSAVAWNELGATQRLRGEFPDAAASYEKAIAADSNFAPAYRNLGVVSDLYLGDPERALTALERYKELTGEDRPVTSWIAELRQRTGKPPLKPAGTAPAPNSSGAAASGATAPGSAAPAAGAPGTAGANAAPGDDAAGNAGSAPAGTTGAAPAASPSKDPAPSKNATPATKPAPKAGG